MLETRTALSVNVPSGERPCKFTILSAVVQGVLEPGLIFRPYALDVVGGS